jgi:hypothetical protein
MQSFQFCIYFRHKINNMLNREQILNNFNDLALIIVNSVGKCDCGI